VADAGLIFVCVGCCCGRDGHGGALAPQRALRLAVTRAYKKAEISGRIRLVFSDCLGPCSESNVLLVYLHGGPLWFRRMNAADLLTTLMDHLRAAVDDPATPLPPSLAARSFSWTGGGTGPEPPIADTELATASGELAR
jgi:(2Fe-2S) ferredoxin